MGSDICFRCGKKTYVVREEKEYIDNSLVITTYNNCTDPECQKIKDKLEMERKKTVLDIAEKKDLRDKERLQNKFMASADSED